MYRIDMHLRRPLPSRVAILQDRGMQDEAEDNPLFNSATPYSSEIYFENELIALQVHIEEFGLKSKVFDLRHTVHDDDSLLQFEVNVITDKLRLKDTVSAISQN